MSFQLFSPSPIVSFLCFLLVVSVNIQLCLGNADIVKACSRPFSCGHITAGYPFWGDDLPVHCGQIPGFNLSCENERTTLMIGEVEYLVLSIDEKSQGLKIARKDIYDNGICQSNISNLPKTSVSELFEISKGYKTMTLRYGFKNGAEEFTCSSEDIIVKDHNTITIRDLGLPRYVSVNVTLPAEFSVGAFRKSVSYLEKELRDGFEVKWKVIGSEFSDKCLQCGGRCGYPLTPDPIQPWLWNPSCYCVNQPFDPFIGPRCSTPPAVDVSSEKKSFFNKPRKIAVGIIASTVGIIMILSMVGMGRLWKKKTEDDQSMEAFIRNCGSHAPRRYTFSDVRNITKSFSEKLGQGAYGNVYKGKMPDGRLVAVKISKEVKGNGEDFINEVASMSRTSHVNIVSLLGFCCERNKRALIYEFMCNGSLDKFTCDTESSATNCNLEWKTLYQIAIGIARGLEYLHKGCNIRIVHFDIKPHNILLDEDFCPKISDFGLAKQSNQKDSIMSMLHIRGTVGYIAPEMFYRKFGGVSYKSDVYSYGMMILEIIGARKNIGIRVSQTSEIYFPDSIYNLLELGKDFDLPSVVTEEEKEIAKRMILVSLWCIQTNPSDRPSMTKVVEMLEGRPEKLQIPPKPYWSSLPRSPKLSLPTSVSTQLASECEML